MSVCTEKYFFVLWFGYDKPDLQTNLLSSQINVFKYCLELKRSTTFLRDPKLGLKRLIMSQGNIKTN